MALFKLKDFSFKYPFGEDYALKRINLTIEKGEFITICGDSGSGKTTLMRQLKPVLAPHGEKEGEILYEERDINRLDLREQASKIGYVLQNPDNQIVTDKVWHELAFGLESLGYDAAEIRLKVGEMASFFGIQHWFHKKVIELSGGQKQLLNLASIMAMQPEVIILDEPTSQLDPVGAINFLDTIKEINRDLGITILIAEHRLEEILPMSDRVFVIDGGKLLIDATPTQAGRLLKEMNHPMFYAMPSPMQIVSHMVQDEYPLTIREGRQSIERYFKNKEIRVSRLEKSYKPASDKKAIEFKHVYFKYEKEGPDIISDLSFSVNEGEFYGLLGGNGTGKTTTLNLVGGMLKPHHGKINLAKKRIVTLPQNPQALFVKKTVLEDLKDIAKDKDAIDRVTKLTHMAYLLKAHPYDLSGGEQQRLALAKILLLEPEILLLDEPTKGMDAYFKRQLAQILRELTSKGVTILMVSHDIEFCAQYVDRCGMFFNGDLISEAPSNIFFSRNSFYTTGSNRMSRFVFENGVTIKDVITLWEKNKA